MKYLIISSFLAIVIGIAFAQLNLEECPKPKAEKSISLKSTLGVWYSIRIGPPCEPEYGTPDCLVEMWWANKEFPDTAADMAIRSKFSNGTISEATGTINSSVTYDKYPENTWQITMFGASAPMTLLDSDNGKSWLLGYSCWELGPKNNSAMWFIASRLPTLDAKVEQTLVKKILAYSPTLKHDDLMAIGHTDCY